MIKATITSQNEQLVIASAKTLDARILQACEIGLARGLLAVVRTAQADYLSGPRPAKLDRVTSRLYGSVTSHVTRNATSVIGRVGSNLKYAAYHEFGFHGTVNVRAHSRVIENLGGKGQSLAVTAGRVVSGILQTRKEVARRQKTGVAVVQFVQAHARSVNYAGKPFVRPALKKNEPVIIAEITKELSTLK